MNPKDVTARIVIEDPKLNDLENHLGGRMISPDLQAYFRKIVVLHKGGTKKINIPSTNNDVGVALLISSNLEETHLEIHDELHVFFAGRIVVIKWAIRGEDGFCVPEKDLSPSEIKKVSVEGEQVTVTLSALRTDFSMLVDFGLHTETSTTTIEIPHPLLNQRPAL